MTDADVAALTGAPVDRDRGDGYQPWPVEPDPEPVWRVAWTILLPRPVGMDRGCINRCARNPVLRQRRWLMLLRLFEVVKCRTQECTRNPFKRRDDFFVVIEVGGVFQRGDGLAAGGER
jgi:hypothetical protein